MNYWIKILNIVFISVIASSNYFPRKLFPWMCSGFLWWIQRRCFSKVFQINVKTWRHWNRALWLQLTLQDGLMSGRHMLSLSYMRSVYRKFLQLCNAALYSCAVWEPRRRLNFGETYRKKLLLGAWRGSLWWLPENCGVILKRKLYAPKQLF